MAAMVVLTTTANKRQAKQLVKALLDDHLVACVNVVNAQSLYRWKGKIESQSECLLIIKTQARLYKKLESRIKQLHPYQVPEIIGFYIHQASLAYLAWITEVVKKG